MQMCLEQHKGLSTTHKLSELEGVCYVIICNVYYNYITVSYKSIITI